MSVKGVIVKFGQKGNEALLKELNQLHTREELPRKNQEEIYMKTERRHETKGDGRNKVRAFMFMT